MLPFNNPISPPVHSRFSRPINKRLVLLTPHSHHATRDAGALQHWRPLEPQHPSQNVAVARAAVEEIPYQVLVLRWQERLIDTCGPVLRQRCTDA
jgi:hypothetical protein